METHQPDSEEFYPSSFGYPPSEQPDRALQPHHPSEARTVQDGKALQAGIFDEREPDETFQSGQNEGASAGRDDPKYPERHRFEASPKICHHSEDRARGDGEEHL